MKLLTIAGVVFLAGCNIGCWFMPCDGLFNAWVTVYDESGAPLPGVAVVVLGRTGETGPDGRFDATHIIKGPGKICVRAEKAGYKGYEGCKRDDYYSIKITLEPTTSKRSSVAIWRGTP